jgi:hypothetical protein
LCFGDRTDQGRRAFETYLRQVFVEPGDVLIRGGSPGHAMLVMDVAEDERGHRIYLLAQSYMPAQDIHIVKNPGNGLTPWYRADSSAGIVETPEYIFKTN